MQDLIAGHIPVITPILSSAVLAQHRAGRARILGVNSDRRLKAAPDIPTSLEGGVPEMRVQVFNGGVRARRNARRGAAAFCARRRSSCAPTRRSCRTSRRPAPSSSRIRTRQQFVSEEVMRWTRVIKAIGFKAQ